MASIFVRVRVDQGGTASGGQQLLDLHRPSITELSQLSQGSQSRKRGALQDYVGRAMGGNSESCAIPSALPSLGVERWPRPMLGDEPRHGDGMAAEIVSRIQAVPLAALPGSSPVSAPPRYAHPLSTSRRSAACATFSVAILSTAAVPLGRTA